MFFVLQFLNLPPHPLGKAPPHPPVLTAPAPRRKMAAPAGHRATVASGDAGRPSYLRKRIPPMLTPRQDAIKSIASAKHVLNRVDFKTVHIKELFGTNVFNEETQ